MAELHERGLAVSLNVHPADGVRAHEDAYPKVAERMGIDPASKLPVNFDPADPEFLEAYLEELHHPLEDDGVDFWWLDWQQGEVTKLPGLDPLWLLNHFHFLDSARNGRRPLTFSRYAGIGSHRYPVGFSGDTVVCWASLEFQPEFTATASNAGYGWWSHDIGGHFFGVKDDELVTRWVQLGVFSPILRLHSTADRFIAKEPWRFGEVARRLIGESLRLRHRLVPYIAHDGPARRATRAPRWSRRCTTTTRRGGGLRRAEPVHVRHRAAGRADHRAGRSRARAWARERLAARGRLDRRLHRPAPTAAAARSRCTATSTRSPCWSGPARSSRWRPTARGTDVPDRARAARVRGRRRASSRSPRTATTSAGRAPASATATASWSSAPSRATGGRCPARAASWWCRTGSRTTSRSSSACSTRAPSTAAGSPTARPRRRARRLFALLDRAHLPNPVKNAIYDAVLAAPTPGDAALELIGMDLRPAVLGAVTELLLAR